jgi:hypothetical protein
MQWENNVADITLEASNIVVTLIFVGLTVGHGVT